MSRNFKNSKGSSWRGNFYQEEKERVFLKVIIFDNKLSNII